MASALSRSGAGIRGSGSQPGQRAAGDEGFLLCAAERLDLELVSQRAAPRRHAPLPNEGHGQSRAGVAGRAAALMLPEPPRKVLGGPGVERAVAASQDV